MDRPIGFEPAASRLYAVSLRLSIRIVPNGTRCNGKMPRGAPSAQADRLPYADQGSRMQPTESKPFVQTPILVGIGMAMQREEDARNAVEPLALMERAVRQAGDDCGVPALLAEVGRIAVPKGRWHYADPAGAIAAAIGAHRATTLLATVGVLQQTLIGDACRRIAEGEVGAALVVGGDSGYRILRARIAGDRAEESQQTSQPDVVLSSPYVRARQTAEIALPACLPPLGSESRQR